MKKEISKKSSLRERKLKAKVFASGFLVIILGVIGFVSLAEDVANSTRCIEDFGCFLLELGSLTLVFLLIFLAWLILYAWGMSLFKFKSVPKK
jgi:hypothetical protein